jgi:pimeloyl-ACP methyl ester carboxylesterase
MAPGKSKNIVFVTGAFVSNACWDEWRIYFESKGYTTIAPPWPFKDRSAEELRRRQPHDTDLARLTLTEVIDSYIRVVNSFPEKPIVIGHSLGGMITQIICNRGYASAAVAIHSVPPLGVFPYEWSFLKSTWGLLGLFSSVRRTYLMSFKKWQYAFTNGMPLSEQEEAYLKYAIPESRTVGRGGLTKAAKIDFKRSPAPLLLTSGSEGTIIPAHLVKREYNKYRRAGNTKVSFKDFPGRNHFVLGQSTWKQDADYILEWLSRVG